MSLTADLAAILHKITDALGPLGNKDELHAEIDAAAAADPEPEPAADPGPPPDPDSPAPVFGTEDPPHAAE